jgi:hypothetical protein
MDEIHDLPEEIVEATQFELDELVRLKVETETLSLRGANSRLWYAMKKAEATNVELYAKVASLTAECAKRKAALEQYADKRHWLSLPSKIQGMPRYPGREWNKKIPGYLIARRALGLEE